MKIQIQGQATAPHTTNQQANAKAAKQPEAQTQPQKEQTVSLSPKAMALSKQAQLAQNKTEEDKAYQFKQPNSLRDRILNAKYDSNLVQQSFRMAAGSGDGMIYLTDRDREHLKEAYIYADKNGLDSKSVNRTAFHLSNLREEEAMERNGIQIAHHVKTPDGFKDLERNDPEYQNSPEYIKRRDEFLEMIKPNPYLQQFVDEVIKVL